MITTIDNRSVEKIQKGNHSIFEKIFDTHFDEIWRFFYLKLADKQEAEDLTSDVFLKFFEYILAGNTIDHVRGFLYQSARNRIIQFYRTKGRTISMSESEFAEDVLLNHDAGIDISHEIDIQLSYEQATKALQELKEEWREVIQLRYIEGFSFSEIARILERSEGAVRVALHRALAEAKKLLKI